VAIKITQGENKTFTITLRDKDGNPFDLSNFSKFKVCLPLENDAKLTLTELINGNGSIVAILGSPLLGKLEVTVNFLDTLNLKPGANQDIGVVLDNAGNTDPRPKNGLGVLTVEDAVCA